MQMMPNIMGKLVGK